MKKSISTFVAAGLGGVIALAGAHFLNTNDAESFSQVKQPDLAGFKMVRYTGTASGAFADFTMAAEKSVNAVVHIKTVSQQVNNLAYDPFAELFFGPQKRQQNFELQGSGSGVIISHDGLHCDQQPCDSRLRQDRSDVE
jgi:serine protease Do